VPGSTPKSSSTGRPEPEAGAENVHDFTAKLRQPDLWGHVSEYVEWQRAVRRARAAGEPAPQIPELGPLSINLDLTTACNYACDHCIDWDILNSKVKHDDDELRAAMTMMAGRGLKSVILIGGGEPTLYPGFPDFVGHLKSLGLQVAVVTNGSRNDRILAAAPHLGKGDWVRLSLDSGKNETFRAMHNPSRKTLDLDEICSWIPKIKRVNPNFVVGFSFIITWKGASREDTKIIENIDEIGRAAERARDAGFDYISFKPFLERSETGSEVMEPEHTEEHLAAVLDKINAGLANARKFEGDGFRVMESINLRVLMKGNWQDYTHQPKTCHMQSLRQVVSPLGVYNCPAHRGLQRAKIGAKDLYKDAESTDRAAGRTALMLDQFDSSVECNHVTCLYNGTNWWLERLIESDMEVSARPSTAEFDAFL